MFVFSPALLLIGDLSTVTLAALTATVGVVCLAGGLHRFFFLGPARWWEQLMLVAAAIVLIKPGLVTDAVGLGLLALTLASQRWIGRPAPQSGLKRG